LKNILILAVIAADIFKANPNLETYHETSDGEAFFNDSDARNHAKTLKDRTVKEVKKGDVKKALPKAIEAVAAIEAATTIEDLEAFKEDTRASVVAALAKRTTELTPAE